MSQSFIFIPEAWFFSNLNKSEFSCIWHDIYNWRKYRNTHFEKIFFKKLGYAEEQLYKWWTGGKRVEYFYVYVIAWNSMYTWKLNFL